jgi:hypothetical protein
MMPSTPYTTYLRILRKVMMNLPLCNRSVSEPSTRISGRVAAVLKRLNNLLLADSLMNRLHIDTPLRQSFLQLQYYQFLHLSDEILRISSSLKIAHGDDEEHIAIEWQTSLACADILVADIIRKLKPAASAQLKPLTSPQIAICDSIFTHPMERLILQWFIEKDKVIESPYLLEDRHYPYVDQLSPFSIFSRLVLAYN